MDSQATKQRVLFVDDDPNLLSGIKHSLRAQGGVWEMHYAGSGEEALQVIDKTLVDVVVSNLWMPGMNGAQLLNEIARLQPHTIRLVLSGHSDERSILRLVGTAHRYIAKPCDSKALKLILERAFMLQALLEDDSLLLVIASVDSLPGCPAIFMELRRKLASPDTTLGELGRLIAKDPPMSAKLLGLWGLPDALVEAVAYSHSPDMPPIHAFGSLTAVHVADVLLQNDLRLNESYLASIGLSHRLPAWRSLAASMVERNKP